MVDSVPLFRGSMPQLYDECLVPALFAPFADVTGFRLAPLSPARVLETAAGTGAVTAALAAALPDAAVVATDISDAMLDEAARRLVGGRVTWRNADAQDLPFDDGSFDAVVCQFGVMFLGDK